MTITTTQTSISTAVERGLDYILSHFREPLWPRTISTKTTEGRQILITSRKETLARFIQAKYLDCRISAYPPNADENRPEINYLLAGFSRYIVNEKYIELINAEKRKQKKPPVHEDQSNRINWIERLLQTPLQDYRKYCIWRIFVPYLLNVRRLSEQEATDIIKDWLSRCNQLRRLDFNYKQKI